jgi:hypothetical protein
MLIKPQRARVFFTSGTYPSGFGNKDNFNLATTGISVIKGAFQAFTTGVAALTMISLI